MVTEELQKKRDHLEAYLKQLGSVVLAFSGGVDSTYLMHEARKVLGDRAMAVTMNLASVPERKWQTPLNTAAGRHPAGSGENGPVRH